MQDIDGVSPFAVQVEAINVVRKKQSSCSRLHVPCLTLHSCKYHAASERSIADGNPQMWVCLGGWQSPVFIVVDDAAIKMEMLRLTQ